MAIKLLDLKMIQGKDQPSPFSLSMLHNF